MVLGHQEDVRDQGWNRHYLCWESDGKVVLSEASWGHHSSLDLSQRGRDGFLMTFTGDFAIPLGKMIRILTTTVSTIFYRLRKAFFLFI